MPGDGCPGAATVDQTGIRGSKPHDLKPSGAASLQGRGSPGTRRRIDEPRVLLLDGFSRHPALDPDSPLTGALERLLGSDRPDEAGELPGAGNNCLLRRLAAAVHPLPALVGAPLGAPGMLGHPGLLASLPALQLIAHLRSAPGVPGGFDQQPAGVRGARLGDRALARLSPEECSDGTRPT